MRVAVIGAGWAGLAAAVEACARGHAVTLLERAPEPGGRARRVDWMVDGERIAIDNGQHILIGAYRDTLALMARVGVRESAVLDRLPLSIEYADGPSIRAPRWPAPLHLAAALLGARGLTWRARRHALAFAASARWHGWRLAADCTVEAMLAARGMDAEAVALLWAPLCLAALNTPIERASAQVFLNVLRDSVGAARADSDLLLPRADLSAVLPQAACAWLSRRGADVRLGAAGNVEAIEAGEAGWRVCAGGAWRAFDAVVIAGGPRAAARLLGQAIESRSGGQTRPASPRPGERATDRVRTRGGTPIDARAVESLQRLQSLESSAITTAWLLLPDGAHWRQPMRALRADRPDSPAQWLFARRARSRSGLRLASAVLSAHAAASTDRAALAVQVLAQIGRELGARSHRPPESIAPPASPVRIIVEREATFLCTPNLRRPGQSTGLAGLWLAGDYVDGPYPGTLESAVRSGLAAARALGPMVPDLPKTSLAPSMTNDS